MSAGVQPPAGVGQRQALGMRAPMSIVGLNRKALAPKHTLIDGEGVKTAAVSPTLCRRKIPRPTPTILFRMDQLG